VVRMGPLRRSVKRYVLLRTGLYQDELQLELQLDGAQNGFRGRDPRPHATRRSHSSRCRWLV
jgi:hypothetical protein